VGKRQLILSTGSAFGAHRSLMRTVSQCTSSQSTRRGSFRELRRCSLSRWRGSSGFESPRRRWRLAMESMAQCGVPRGRQGCPLYGGELSHDVQGLIVGLISNLQHQSDSRLDTTKGVVLILLQFAVGSQRSLVPLRLGAGFTGWHDPDDAAWTGWSVAAPAWTAGLGRCGSSMQHTG
jgi:hypothetical protein